MNKIIFGFLILILPNCGTSQEIVSIEYYLNQWDAKTVVARKPDNFKDLHHYYFKNYSPDFFLMFDDLSDCINKIESREKIEGTRIMKSMVCLNFKEGSIKIYFDSQGNYYYNKNWYKRQNAFYYKLFCFFSNKLISNKILEEAKSKIKQEFWSD